MPEFFLPERQLKGKISPQEWALRVNLAACYRLTAHYGWDDTIYTHISARLPGKSEYLVNAYGLTFDEITASNLVKVDINGNILEKNPPFPINPAGFTIHSAIHAVRHDAQCVIHLHTNEAIAVATQEAGLLPLSQYAMLVLPSLAYHGYEGLAVHEEEKHRLQKDLGTNNFFLLPNHGALTVGRTVGEALMRFGDLQRACEVQVMLQSTGQKTIPVHKRLIETAKQQAHAVHIGSTGGERSWPAMLRLAYRLDPKFME